MNLGKSLKMALAKRDVKNKDLAAHLKTTEQHVSSWVTNGSISQKNLVKICEFLTMPVSEFVALGEE